MTLSSTIFRTVVLWRTLEEINISTYYVDWCAERYVEMFSIASKLHQKTTVVEIGNLFLKPTSQ